jgi:hypothetical protein
MRPHDLTPFPLSFVRAVAQTSEMSRGFLSLVMIVGAVAVLGRAEADENDARDRARGLAEQAEDLLDTRQYADALDRAGKAEELYHAPTNVLMIAEAQEGLGHLAAAADTYEKLVAEPLPQSAPHAFLAAQQTGNQRLDALLARVPSMLVTVKGGPIGEEVAVTVDGRQIVTRGGIAARFDPGPHEVRVSAPGYRPFEQTVTLPERGGVNVIEALLSPAPPAAVPIVPPLSADHLSAPRPTSGSRVPAYVAFGVGGAGVILGTITGVLSLSKVSDLTAACPGDKCSTSEQGTVNSAQALGTTSTIGFVVGGLGIAAGAVLLLIHPWGGRTMGPSSASMASWIGIGGSGLEGRF